MDTSNTTVQTNVATNSPIFTLELTSDDLYTIGGVIVFLILLIFLFC